MCEKRFQPSKSTSPGSGRLTASFCSSVRALRITPEELSMTRDEALPDSYSAQGFYENYEPKEILGR